MDLSNKKIVWYGNSKNQNTITILKFLQNCNITPMWVETSPSMLGKTVVAQKPDWIFLDLDRKELFEYVNGEFAYENIIENFKTPVIFVGTMTDWYRMSDAFSIKNFIAYEHDEQMIAVQLKNTSSKKEDLTGIFEEDYCGINIEDFLVIKYCPYDMYCRISESKVVKIVNRFDEINQDLILKLKGKGVLRLFLTKADYQKYVFYGSYSIKNTNTLTPKEKVAWLGKNVSSIMDDVYHYGLNQDNFLAAKQNVETVVQLAIDDKMIFDLINVLNTYDNDLYKHSLGMSVYSVMLAKQMKIVEPKLIFRLSVGGLFADIGMKEVPPEILAKNRILMTHKDLKFYNMHPEYSANILRTLPGLPADLIQMVFQHHENEDCSGFPSRSSANDIHPLAKILRVVDEFCFLTLRSANNPNFVSPAKAVEQMKSPMYVKKFDQKVLKSLEDLVFQGIKDLSKKVA